jgi:hypothetical protein
MKVFDELKKKTEDETPMYLKLQEFATMNRVKD